MLQLDTMDKKRKLHISLNATVYEKLQEMAEYNGASISDFIRQLINNYHGKEYRIARVGHQGGADSIGRRAAKEDRADLLLKLETMSDEDLTAYLKGIGYIKEPELFNEATGAMRHERIITNHEGIRKLITEDFIPNEIDESTGLPRISYSSEDMTWKNVVDDLIKNKYI